MSLIRVGVIGCGVMGKHHARVYSEMPGVKLVAAVEVALAIRKSLKEGKPIGLPLSSRN